MWALCGKREEMLEAIGRHRGEREVWIKAKPSKKIFFLLLEKTGVKRLIMARGIAATVPQKIYAGLENAGVKVEVVEGRRGRPEKYKRETKKKLLAAVKAGESIDAAIKKFKVSRRSYFYWKKKAGSSGGFPKA